MGCIFTSFRSGRTNARIIGSSNNVTVTVNGRTYTGNNVQIENEKVYVDNQRVDETMVSGSAKVIYMPLSVNVIGDAQSITVVSGNVIVNSVNTIKTTSGNVSVSGNSGNIQTVSGDVTINGTVAGSVKTISGDIRTQSRHYGT